MGRLLLLMVLATAGCRTSEREFLGRTDRVRQRDAESHAAGLREHLADRDLDRAIMEQQENRK